MEYPWSVRPSVARTAVENKRSFARRKSRDPENMQATRRGRLPYRGRVEARGTRKIDPSRTSVNAAPLVGAPPTGVESCRAPGAAAAGSLRRTLPGGVQGESLRDPRRSASAASGRHGTPQGALVVHRRVRELGHGREPDVLERGAEPRTGGPRGGTARRGSVRGRGLNSTGGATARLRGVRERSESRRVSDPQGDAGGYPAARCGIGRRASEGRWGNQGRRRTGVGGPLPGRPRRREAHRLSVGADRAVRGAELRSRDSADALIVAMQEEPPQASVAAERATRRWRPAAGQVRDLRTGHRRRRTGGGP